MAWRCPPSSGSGPFQGGPTTTTCARFVAFMVEQPKRREIFAADFRDWVVHHLLVAHMERTWERRFIHESFACRRRKGTHRGSIGCARSRAR